MKTSTLPGELQRARANTDALFEVVQPHALYERPIPERHRIIFYVGHLEAFDWNLCREATGAEVFHESFDRLFAFGIDPPVGETTEDQPADWPAIDEVLEYRRRTRTLLDNALDRVPPQYLHVAIEHRLMHAETFAYMLHNLPYEAKRPQAQAERRGAGNLNGGLVEVPAGEVTLGLARGAEFGWDNEYEAHTVEMPAFAIQRHKVTNGDYMEFVRAGAAAPHFWTCGRGEWYYRGMFAEFPLPLDWPVYVTHNEASAYAAWRGGTLPAEEQIERAAYGAGGPYPWGAATPDLVRGNFDFGRWDPVPVDSTPAGDTETGISQLVGNGWEWTSTVFAPFPGFEPFPFYPGYSANFFDGRHYVMKGGSPRTAACMLRRSFRNWFRPEYPYVYAGFRLVTS